MASLVCIDTQLLIWGVQRTSHVGQEGMIPATLTLFHEWHKLGQRVMVPSIAFGEFLGGCGDEERVQYQNIIMKDFIVAPFDARASFKYAQVLYPRWASLKQTELATGTVNSRTALKADFMIIATALAYGATQLYGHEKKFEQYVDGLPIEFVNIATREAQQNMLAQIDVVEAEQES